MKVLAIDTSSDICSVAIVENDKIIKEMHNKSEKEHSQTLMPMIKSILESANLTLDNINLLACGIGPGSFTGIRIGIATVKAFSDAKDIPIIGINSLEAMAYATIMRQGKDDCKVLSMIDARYENVYFAVYRMHNGKLSIYKNPDITNISETIDYINLQEPLYLIGDTIPEKLEPFIKAKSSKEMAEGKDIKEHKYLSMKLEEDEIYIINEKELTKDEWKNDKTTSIPTMAEAVGISAINKYENGNYESLEEISPMYLRRTQAERQRNGEDEKTYILTMFQTDLEKMKLNYEDFPNIWDYNTFEEDYKNSNYIVAKQNDEIVGFVGTRTALDELEIMNIVTRKDKRKNGIASNLLSYIIRNNDVQKINLEVNEHNITAINLYKKFGFRQVGLRKKYYNNTDNAILMTL